jgi:N-acetyl-anhydromuramyl-L-alanine amidase AmpD
MLDIVQQISSNVSGKQKKKKQIILSHTGRDVEEYLMMLKYRNNGKYKKTPHYVISKSGQIIQKLFDESYSDYFYEPNINRNSIIIVFENLGWLNKVPLKDYYTNWIGNIYKGVPYERKWRDYHFWDPYTSLQIQSASKLCLNLVEEHKIEKKCVGHNTKVKDVSKIGGIVSRSNFDDIYTDLNPSFDFENFTNLIKNEQLV